MQGQAMGGHARGGQGARDGGDYYGAPIYDYYQGGAPVYDYYQDGAPIYDSCDSYYRNGCPPYGVPFVSGLINGVLGGY
jgi:hypothetical protein